MERRSLIISILLHTLVGTIAWFGLPSLKRDLPDEQPILLMEVVREVPKTNLQEGDKLNTAKKETIATRLTKPKLSPRPKSKSAPEMVPESKAKQLVDQTAEVIPEKIKPQPKMALAQTPAPPKSKPRKKTRVDTPAKLPKSPPKRINKIKLEQSRKKQQAKALSGLMENLAKITPVPKDAEKAKRDKERKILAKKLEKSLTKSVGNAIGAPKESITGETGAEYEIRLNHHVSGFFSPTPGLSAKKGLNLNIFIRVDNEGRVLLAEEGKASGWESHRAFKVIAADAIRASKKASPIPLPKNRKNREKALREGIEFNFDPCKKAVICVN